MADVRQKNKQWRCADADGSISYDQAQLAVLMDIRDELVTIRSLAQCYRLPRALDAVVELARAERRRKRLVKERAKRKKRK